MGRRGIYQKASVGTIFLLPETDESSGLVSVEALAAPKDALKAYDKAEEDLAKNEVNLDDVVANLQKAVRLYPEYTAAWNLLGECYIRRSELGQAREALMAAIQLDSRFVEPCVTLAFIALKQGRLIKAAAAAAAQLKERKQAGYFP